jgi:ribosomal protein S18 acetylase RimI-like enzyme
LQLLFTMNITIRKASPSDYILIGEIGRCTFYETWRPVNTEEDMQSYMNSAFDHVILKSEIENQSTNTYLMAYVLDRLVGYAKLRRDRAYDEFNNEPALEIERIYVKQQWHNMKIGRALMDECLKIATDEKVKWIWLGVNIDNHKAINFYKKYNFTIFGEKSFLLGQANDNDYLMKRNMI